MREVLATKCGMDSLRAICKEGSYSTSIQIGYASLKASKMVSSGMRVFALRQLQRIWLGMFSEVKSAKDFRFTKRKVGCDMAELI